MLLRSQAIAEALGTFAIAFAGCGSVMVAERFPQGGLSSVETAVVFGLAVATMIFALGRVSGAHFNPAVTLAFAVARLFPARRVLSYWAAQIAGAVAAIALLSGLLPDGLSYGATVPGVPELQAFAWEVVLTFLLMLVVIAVATDSRAEGIMAGTAIGAVVALCAMLAGPVTGASMNPARSLAPALFEGRLNVVWIYFMGPMIGAVLAALVYQAIRCEPADKDAKGCC